jgi:hypothetical protein
MSDYYSSVDSVVQSSGAKAKDLGFDDDDSLETFIEERLVEIKDLIDTECSRDFTDEGTVPGGIDRIALGMACDFLSMAMLRRDTPIVRIDDFNVRSVKDEIFTPEVIKSLQRYKQKVQLGIITIYDDDDEDDD